MIISLPSPLSHHTNPPIVNSTPAKLHYSASPTTYSLPAISRKLPLSCFSISRLPLTLLTTTFSSPDSQLLLASPELLITSSPPTYQIELNLSLSPLIFLRPLLSPPAFPKAPSLDHSFSTSTLPRLPLSSRTPP